MSDPGAVVRLDGVSAGYGGRAVVSDVDLVVPAGGVAWLRGPNGSGKSTLLRVLAGRLRPLRGHATVLGVPAHEPAAARATWFMTTTAALHEHLTVGEQVRLFAGVHRRPMTTALQTLDALGMKATTDTLTYHLSTGQRRKLWFALTTGSSARPVLLLDEPFNEVDTSSVEIMIQLLADLRAAGRTLVLSTHVAGDAVGAMPGVQVVDVGPEGSAQQDSRAQEASPPRGDASDPVRRAAASAEHRTLRG